MFCVFRWSGWPRTLASFCFLPLWFLPLLRLPRLLCRFLLHSPRPLFFDARLLMLLRLLGLLLLGLLPLFRLPFDRLLLLLPLTLIRPCVAGVLHRRPPPFSLGVALGTIHVLGAILLWRCFASIDRFFVLGWRVGLRASVGGAAS